MKRQIVYQGQIPLETDLLLTNKNVMLAMGSMMQAVFGSNASVDGLACTPNSPAAMNVLVAPGVIHSLQNIDNTAYGTVAADTTKQVMKQGLIDTTSTLNCPAPATTGQSIVYLVQAAFQETDEGSTVLPYYDATNPSDPWSGPGGTGVSQNTVRNDKCIVSVKAGTPATTGSQVTPAPDAGYTGLYAITVANGATSITSPNIQRLTTAPFIDAKLPTLLATVQSGAVSYCADTSGAANTLTATLNPNKGAPTDGMRVAIKAANSVTGATVFNLNGTGNVAVVTTSGAALSANAMVASGIYTLVYDANGNRWQLQGFTAASATGLIPANNLSDVSNAATALSNIGGTVPTGIVWDFEGAEASVPAGWLLCSGKTIGSASSGATARANADTQALFNLLWTDHTNATRPIFTSAGGASTRGANAAADWAANKRISLADDRGRASVGKDDMGGTAANRVTTGGSGVDGATLGASGGAETHALTAGEMPAHAHTAAAFESTSGASGTNTGGRYLVNAVGSGSTQLATNPQTDSQGSGQAHTIMQPSNVRNRIVKL